MKFESLGKATFTGKGRCMNCGRKIRVREGQEQRMVWAIRDDGSAVGNICLSCMRELKNEGSPHEAIRFTGRIKRETAKAVLFIQIGNEDLESLPGSVWLPKSQIQVFERAMGPLDQIEVPRWLVEKKQAAA